MSTPIPYPQPAPMINPHIPMGPYTHLHHPPPPPYAMANGPTFYQPSPQSTAVFQQALTTPYHPHHLQMAPGLPPHAPLAVQRTVNFTTNDTNNYRQQSQSHSPTSIQAQEINIQALQQRIIEQQKHQQTPISLQRQMNRLPTVDYPQLVNLRLKSSFLFFLNSIYLDMIFIDQHQIMVFQCQCNHVITRP